MKLTAKLETIKKQRDELKVDLETLQMEYAKLKEKSEQTELTVRKLNMGKAKLDDVLSLWEKHLGTIQE